MNKGCSRVQEYQRWRLGIFDMDEDRMDQMIEKCKILKKKRAEELKIGVASRRRDGKWYPKGTRPSNTPVKSLGRRKGLWNQRQREFDQGRQEVTVAAPQTATSGLKIRLSAVAIRSALGDDSRESTNTLENKLEDVRGTDLDAGRAVDPVTLVLHFTVIAAN